jgi:hypothetical protein
MNSVKLKRNVSENVIVPRSIIKSRGKMYYKEANRAWCFLRLRKEILDEFDELREKYCNFSYDVVYYETYEELEKALRDFKKGGQPLPILMWLVRDMKELPS